jgi:periplasmic protein TonB
VSETAENAIGSRLLDAPEWRLLWIGPLAVIAWAVLLAGFARMLAQSVKVAPEPPLVARLVVLPPPAGLAGPSAPAPAVPHNPPKPQVRPKPVHIVHPRPRPLVRHKPVAPTPPPSETGIAKETEAPVAPSPPASSAGGSVGSNRGGASNGAATGLGSDNLGAQALYAPTPSIPDDLRDEPFSAIAVAHFTVSYSGAVTVVLSKPTDNPRFNEVILDALKQWRFAPAKKNGVAINSAFDLQIPITIQ